MAIGPNLDIGRDLKLYVSTQASFDIATNGTTAGENYPVAGDAIRLITGSAGGSMPFATREDKFATATYIGGIQQKMTAEASLDTYLAVNGTAAQIPDIGPDLLAGGGWELVDTRAISTTVASNTDATVFVTTSATGFEEGGAVAVEDEDDEDLYHLRRIKTIAGTTITVEPPLPAAPSAAQKLRGCASYKPNDSRDGGNSDLTAQALTVFMGNNRSCDQVESFFPTSFGFSLGGDSAARLSVSGTGKRTMRMMGTTAAEAVDATETAIDVANAKIFEGLDNLAVPAYYQIDDEVLKVESVAGDTITVAARGSYAGGSGAVEHDSGTPIVPHMPTPTITGGPVPATSGSIYYCEYGDTSATALQMTTSTIDCGFGVTTRDNVHGSTAVVAGYTMNIREVNLSMSGWTLYDSDFELQGDVMAGWYSNVGTGATSQQCSVVVQQGTELGSSVALVAPRFRPTMASLDRGAEEVTVEASGICEGTSSGADEILLIFS